MLQDDRTPMLLVILDGLGDRQSSGLQGMTPCEAAQTQVLDQLAIAGQSGVLIPFGLGQSTSSETSHWSLFGFEDIPFVGRAALEGAGVGHTLPENTPMFHLALRQGLVKKEGIYLGSRARRSNDDADARDLFSAIDGQDIEGVRFRQLPLRTGECVLIAENAVSRDVSDSDALFDHVHPWMRPVALTGAPSGAKTFASILERWLLMSHTLLNNHPINERREAKGQTVLNVPVTKWASFIDPGMPDFETHAGVAGAAVTDAALYRGFASLLDMKSIDIPYDRGDPKGDMERRIEAATSLLQTSDFVHVHVKATDEAGHAKDPKFKRDIIEQTVAGLHQLEELSKDTVVAVTGDHATPSTGSLLHSGDPTPFVIAGPDVDRDQVECFGERYSAQGMLGRLRAKDVLPVMAGFANRPFFRGHQPGPYRTIALPNNPEPMTVPVSRRDL
ncbi:MAG: phosphoglycerate mutase [Pseudomonadota bacterium]